MCSRVRMFTSPLSFRARETVAIETPARAATSLIVGRSLTTRTIWPGQLRPPGRESFRGENDQRRRRDFWETSQSGDKGGSNLSTETHPSAPARLIVAAAIVLVGITLGVNTGGTIVTLAIAVTAYLLLLVGVVWATRERRHGIALAATALVVGLVSALLAP